MTRKLIPAAAALLALAGLAPVRPAAAEQVVVPLSHPGQPARVEVHTLMAGISVEAYDGKEVVIDSQPAKDEKEPPPPPKARGLKRISGAGFGLTAEEKDNQVEVKVDGPVGGKLSIKVPRDTSLQLKTVNGGEVSVRGVHGELELGNVNGGITAIDVSGSVVAHTTNGAIKVILHKVAQGEPMSFVTLNGDVDVTLPPDLKATLNLQSNQGEVYTDFDVDVNSSASTTGPESAGGRYRVEINRAVRGTVHGGGPEITLRTFNGDIYVRKGGAGGS